MARSPRRGSRSLSPHVSRVLQHNAADLARLTGRSLEDARLLQFIAIEQACGREPVATVVRAQTRVVEALDATSTHFTKLSDDQIVQHELVDHRTRLEASARVLSQVGMETEARGPSAGNILLQVRLADGSLVQLGVGGKAEPRVVGPGLDGGGG